jgi:hypothetical protein
VNEAFDRSALIELALGDDAVASAAAGATTGAERWPQLCRLAAQWRVVPQVLARCGAVDRFDAPLRARMRALMVAQAARSASLLRTCAGVQEILGNAGLDSVAIKGIAAIATLYGAASRRMIADVDLIIEPHGLSAARTALEGAGFADISPPFESHVAAIGFSRYLHNYARTFVRDGIEIDLHWRLGPRPPAPLVAQRILERSVRARVERIDVRVSGPVETALIAVHHALRSSFPASSTLKDAADLALWWNLFGDLHGEALIATSRECGLASSLLALSRVIAAYNCSDAIGRGIAALEAALPRAEHREAERLRAFIEHNLRVESPDDATVELLAPAVFTRSLVGPLLHGFGRNRTRESGRGAGAPPIRRPVLARIRSRLERAAKIGRELLRFDRVASYRAVARAQSRFH